MAQTNNPTIQKLGAAGAGVFTFGAGGA